MRLELGHVLKIKQKLYRLKHSFYSHDSYEYEKKISLLKNSSKQIKTQYNHI